MDSQSNFSHALNFVNSFSKSGKPVRDLSRIAALLERLGNPHKALRFIHIAGTNGKGSCAQMFAEIYTGASFRTGLSTSPYMIEYADRIRVDGANIPPAALERHAWTVEAALEADPARGDYSQFEITMAIGLLHFLQRNCELVVFEAGLGGLMDSTNVIPPPLLTVITSVSLDHTAILGNTLSEIAAQKAGILKPGSPCVLSAGNPADAVNVIAARAEQVGAKLLVPNEKALTIDRIDLFGTMFSYRGRRYRTRMTGLHQITNALTVIEGAALLSQMHRDLAVSGEQICAGIAKAAVCARTEVLSRDPLVILDGGHNEGGFAALAAVLQTLGGAPVTVFVGMLSDKNAAQALAKLVPLASEFICTDGFYPNAAPKETLCALIASLGGTARCCGELESELEQAITAGKGGGRAFVICGSLYLCAAVRRMALWNGRAE
ncbi:MAG: folylpolyglutamate synthase/dihydrofolate synthase family protein [Oscillospiraceae bacterium]